MGLFSRPNTVAQQQQTENNVAPPSAQPSVQEIVGAVMKEMLPLLQRQSVQPTEAAPQEPEPEVDDDPEGTERITKIAAKTVNTLTAPAAGIFNMVMPEYARDVAVRKLSDGQKLLYEKYKAEVDEGVRLACQTNPSLMAVPQVHTNAIRLVLGDHTDEIESLVLQHLKPEELPVHLKPPTTTGNGGPESGVEATASEKEWLSWWGPRSRAKDWDVDNMRYYKEMNTSNRPLHEIVAEHKARMEAQSAKS